MTNLALHGWTPVPIVEHLTEQLRVARDIAVSLEQEVAAVDELHRPLMTCTQHGLRNHDCGSGWNYRCYMCIGRDFRQPCPTWRITHPEWDT